MGMKERVYWHQRLAVEFPEMFRKFNDAVAQRKYRYFRIGPSEEGCLQFYMESPDEVIDIRIGTLSEEELEKVLENPDFITEYPETLTPPIEQEEAPVLSSHRTLEGIEVERSTWQPGQPRLSTDGQAIWDVDRAIWSTRPNHPWQDGEPIISPDGMWLRSWSADGPLWIPYGRWQTYTMVRAHPKTGVVTIYTGQTSGEDLPEENVRARYLAHVYRDKMTPEEGWQPAVLDQFSNDKRLIAAREQQLALFYEQLGMRDLQNPRVPGSSSGKARRVFGNVPDKGIHQILLGQDLVAASTTGWTIFVKENSMGQVYVGVLRKAGTAALNLARVDRRFAQEGKSTVTGWKPAVEIRFNEDKNAIYGYAELLARKLAREGRLAPDSWRLKNYPETMRMQIAAGRQKWGEP